ncbi:ABC transporter ATP-binding protein [Halobacterium bonnevillei]|uniref:Molybdate/tungstate import ATP-binding protein WtpC n=1 Tax=Halobacterium bonnevillei TaxID=2692200 RepID=A0A6B0SHX3_9EURY|nr:ABC transporter ATP-binding protein [Halobacterium bonnevillei]MXR21285.1 ATP-binding cassette domain-containing protein [Halobacterium bonnevillei]
MAFLELDNLRKEFGDLVAVDGVSLSIEEGQFVTIVGPSGCGKSTILRSITGLETPSSGEIRLEGTDITELPAYRRNIGLVFQDYALFPHKTVFENVAFGLKMRGAPKAEQRERVEEMLEMVNLEGYQEKYPEECSGGEQQRIAVARAIAFDPDLVLMDEPLSNLDKNLRTSIRSELRRIQDETGVTTVYVTHNQNEALSLGDKLAVMNDGHLEQFDDPETVYRNPQTRFVADFLGRSTEVRGTYHRQNGEAVAELGGGIELQVQPSGSLADGDPASLFLRDEKLKLVDGSAPTENVLEGIIESVDYRGRDINYFIEVPKIGQTVQVSHIADHSTETFHTLGDAVSVYIEPENVTCLPADDSQP